MDPYFSPKVTSKHIQRLRVTLSSFFSEGILLHDAGVPVLAANGWRNLLNYWLPLAVIVGVDGAGVLSGAALRSGIHLSRSASNSGISFFATG